MSLISLFYQFSDILANNINISQILQFYMSSFALS